MSRLWARLRYFVTDAWDAWRRSPGVHLLATATLAGALFLAALVLLVVANLARQIEQWRRDLRVHVYLADGLVEDQRQAIAAQLRALPGVAAVGYVDKAEALRRFRRAFGDSLAGVTEALGDNPLPASFEVELQAGADAPAAIEELAAAAGKLEGVEEVRYDRAWLDRVGTLLRTARIVGLCLAVPVFAAVALVMASVLRLAVYARREEIEIMLLVGATPGLVRGPFLVAGLAQGLLAAALALALVEAARRALLWQAGADPVALLSLVLGAPLPLRAAGLVATTGGLVGLLGSFVAVRRY